MRDRTRGGGRREGSRSDRADQAGSGRAGGEGAGMSENAITETIHPTPLPEGMTPAEWFALRDLVQTVGDMCALYESLPEARA